MIGGSKDGGHERARERTLVISPDRRLHAIALLLAPAFVGHFIQLSREDTPWTAEAAVRYLVTPGLHRHLDPTVPMLIAAAVPICVAGLVLFRTRPWLLAVVGTYLAHYLTWPYRIRNHMTLMGTCLLVIGVLSFIGRGRDRRSVDRQICSGIAAVLVITYFFAGFHKLNTSWITLDAASSSAVAGMADFLRHGSITHHPPAWINALAAYGTLVIELGVPVVAWRSERLRIPAIFVLMAFHFPQIAVMNVADYPMLASAFWPALFSVEQWDRVEARIRAVDRWTVGGAALGIAAQLWFIPWWGWMTGFGALVMALWGWAAGAVLRPEGAIAATRTHEPRESGNPRGSDSRKEQVLDE